MITLDSQILIDSLVFLPGGIVGCHQHFNERRWGHRPEGLLLMDGHGVPIWKFSTVYESGGEQTLAGVRRGSDVVSVRLQQISQPSLERWPADPWDGRRAKFIERPFGELRQNVVVVCANENSLHKEWSKFNWDGERNFDLCITFYGEDPSHAERPFEFLTHQPGQPKWHALFNLFYPDSPLWDYEYVWLPDDDLLTNWREISALFEICRRFGLSLAQPSIDPSSNVNHLITQTDPKYKLRFTSFVEIMCPLFSRNALRVCLPTFRDTKSGYGLDSIWPKLVGGIPNQVAIIDALSVAHTRPIGKNYDMAAALREGREMLSLYKSGSSKVLGGIFDGDIV